MLAETSWAIMIKRTLDIAVSAVALLVFSPMLLVIGWLISRKMGRPVYFVQQRPGLNGKPFNMVKFRTMKDAIGADGAPLPDADRLTDFGKFLRSSSIDELPGLWNVLKGDMSLVGPRPLLMEYLERYSKEQARRGISPKYVEEGGFSVLNQKCVRAQRVLFGDSRRHGKELPSDSERLLRLGDVVVNSTGVGTLGRVAFIRRLREECTTVDSHVTIVRAETNKVNCQYLAWTMLRYQKIIEAAANGSTGQVELNKSYLEELNLVLPSSRLQLEFCNKSRINESIAIKERENEQLIELRDWLLPMLMNGQVTVKT